MGLWSWCSVKASNQIKDVLQYILSAQQLQQGMINER
jgi:hypothetical protein